MSIINDTDVYQVTLDEISDRIRKALESHRRDIISIGDLAMEIAEDYDMRDAWNAFVDTVNPALLYDFNKCTREFRMLKTITLTIKATVDATDEDAALELFDDMSYDIDVAGDFDYYDHDEDDSDISET